MFLYCSAFYQMTGKKSAEREYFYCVLVIYNTVKILAIFCIILLPVTDCSMYISDCQAQSFITLL